MNDPILPSIKLRPEEEAVVISLNELHPSGGEDGVLIPFRAHILRRLILGLPLQMQAQQDDAASPIPLPKAGLRLRYLCVVGSNESKPYDKTATLFLEDACSPEGRALPPLELVSCTFYQSIFLSGARFRNLSLKNSKLTHLKGTNLVVEGHLRLAGIQSPLVDIGCNLAVPDREEGEQQKSHIKGASHLDEGVALIARAIPKLLPNETFPLLSEDDRALSEGINAAAPSTPLCWVELRNAHIGVDVDVIGAKLAAPEAEPKLTNSPHARYALDLRGATIGGRLTWSPDFRNPDDSQFVAIGGVSVVRATIHGSLCGSGGRLVAVEGCALAAERAHIHGHLFLDYSWEGAADWRGFEAQGFIDLTNASIGSSIFMAAAQLRRDHWLRAGLVLSQATIGDDCDLSAAVETIWSGSPRSRSALEPGKIRSFYSAGGVRMDNATIRGRLNLNGAELQPDSFSKALYASGLSVSGTADLSVYLPAGCSETSCKRFTAHGPVILVGARFDKTLNLRGSRIDISSLDNDDFIDDPSNEYGVQAHLVQVKSSVYMDYVPAKGNEEEIRTEVVGAISFRRASIGMNARFAHAYIKARIGKRYVARGRALDLSNSTIHGCLYLNDVPRPDSDPDSPGSAKPPGISLDPDNCPRWGLSKRFHAVGTVALQGACIGDELQIVGALIRPKHGSDALMAAGIHVASKAQIGKERTFDLRIRARRIGKTVPRLEILRRLHAKTYLESDSRRLWPANPSRQQSKRPHLTQILAAHGTVDFSRAVIPAGLYLNGALIDAGNFFTPGTSVSQIDERRPKMAFHATSANINFLRIVDCRFKGPVSLSDIHAPQGVRIVDTTIKHGWLDIWKSSLGLLDLLQLHFEEPREMKNSGGDILQFGSSKISGSLTIQNSIDQRGQPGTRFYANLRDLEIGALRDESGWGWGKDLRTKLVGFTSHRAPTRISSDIPVNTPLLGFSGRFATWMWNRKPKGVHRRDRRPTPFRQGFFSVVFSILPAFVWRVPFFLATRLWGHFNKAEAHVHWLNRQYENVQKPSHDDFNPSSYDQLAKVLREDGQDKLAQRVLSAKFDAKRVADVPGAGRLLWRAYSFFFDYGLDTASALATLLVYLSVGTLMIWFLAGRHHKLVREHLPASEHAILLAVDPSSSAPRPVVSAPVPDAAQNKGTDREAVQTPDRTPSERLQSRELPPYRTRSVAKHSERDKIDIDVGSPPSHPSTVVTSSSTHNTQAPKLVSSTQPARSAAPPQPSAQQKAHEFAGASGRLVEPEECSRFVDALRYSFEHAVPFIHFGENGCQIHDDTRPGVWELGQILYTFFGWLITSITVLTIPGVLRSRAESD